MEYLLFVLKQSEKFVVSVFFFFKIIFDGWRYFTGDVNSCQLSSVGVTTWFHAGASSATTTTTTNIDVANIPSTSSSTMIHGIVKGFSYLIFDLSAFQKKVFHVFLSFLLSSKCSNFSNLNSLFFCMYVCIYMYVLLYVNLTHETKIHLRYL